MDTATWLQMLQSGQGPTDEAQRSEGAMLANQMFAADPGVSNRLSADQMHSLMPWLTASSGGDTPGMYFSGPNTAPGQIHAPGPSVPEVNYPPPHSDPIPPPLTPSFGPSNPPGFPEAKPPTQQKLDDVFTAPNSSSSFSAARMPTFANNPAPVASNAIPVGDIPGRTAQGLLSTRNAPNYIQGLLSKYNPGNWQGGQADIMSRGMTQSTPTRRKRTGVGDPDLSSLYPAQTTPTFPGPGQTSYPDAPVSTASFTPDTPTTTPDTTGTGTGAIPPQGQWHMGNGGIIIGYRRDYSPIFGPPGSTQYDPADPFKIQPFV